MLHRVNIFFFSLLFFTTSCKAQQDNKEVTEFKKMLVAIREMKISPDEARSNFQTILKNLHKNHPIEHVDSSQVQLVFPLVGKNYKAVGGNGKGFYARHFNLFDHSISKSHPAHDIFIYDLNRDCKEDGTEKYIEAVAVSEGVVIALENNWKTSDDFNKGGNYVWYLDLATGGLWYYAHLNEVQVKVNQKLKAGDLIGTVGRTGFNAKTNRSDTHLHLMYLSIDENYNPRPINHYQWLRNAQTIKQSSKAFYNPFKELSIAPIKGLQLRTTLLPIRFGISTFKPKLLPLG